MTTTTTCPSWCIKHPATGEETHQSETWRGPEGLTISFEHSAEDGIEVYIDHGPDEYLALTPEQVLAVAPELVRVVAQIQQSV